MPILYTVSEGSNRVDEYSVRGSLVRTVTLPPPKPVGFTTGARLNYILSVAPDGSRLLLNDDTILASDGREMGRLDPASGLFGALWGDDDHLCQLSTSDYVSSGGKQVTGAAWLQWVTLHRDQPPTLTKVGDLGTVSVGHPGSTHDYAIAACSAAADQAVVVTRDSAAPGAQNLRGRCVTEVRTFRLSTGTPLSRLAWPQPRIVRASADAEVIASAPCALSEPLFTWIDRLAGNAPERLLSVVGVLPDGLSGDGSVAVLRQPLSDARPETRLMDISVGHVARAWSSHGVNVVVGWPGTREVYVGMPAQGGGYELHLVSANSDVVVASRVFAVVAPLAS